MSKKREFNEKLNRKRYAHITKLNFSSRAIARSHTTRINFFLRQYTIVKILLLYLESINDRKIESILT